MIFADVPHSPPTYECLYEEAARQKLPAELLLAVMKQEGGKMGQFVRNKNGTYDIGPMQINTFWLKKIATKFNTTQAHIAISLAYHGCWNMAVGAWVLRGAIDEAKGDVWKGVGYYNSHDPIIGPKYAARVQRHYKQIVAEAEKLTGDKASNKGPLRSAAPVEPKTVATTKQISPNVSVPQQKTTVPVDAKWSPVYNPKNVVTILSKTEEE